MEFMLWPSPACSMEGPSVLQNPLQIDEVQMTKGLSGSGAVTAEQLPVHRSDNCRKDVERQLCFSCAYNG